MATDLALDNEIDYQFDCRRASVMEKIFIKIYKRDNHSSIWNVLPNALTPEYMRRHPEKSWNHSCLCTISIDKILDEKTLAEIEEQIQKMNDELTRVNICECVVCRNSNDLLLTRHRNNWIKFSANTNVSLELIEKYLDKDWNVYCLAENSMTGAKAQFKKEYLAALKIQEAAALKIQEMFLQAKFNPAYAYCRRLHREFYQLL